MGRKFTSIVNFLSILFVGRNKEVGRKRGLMSQVHEAQLRLLIGGNAVQERKAKAHVLECVTCLRQLARSLGKLAATGALPPSERVIQSLRQRARRRAE